MKRVAAVLATLLAVWIACLVVLGFALADRTARKVASRFGESLQAKATIADARLGLVTGGFTFEHMSVRRDDAIGHLVLDVGAVDCDLLPLGLALVDRTCGDLDVRDVRLEVSTIGLFQIRRPKRAPFRADRIVIDNAELVFSPSAFVPSLGQVRIHIEHAEAGATTFKTPLSWVFALRELRAAFDLPAGITLRIGYVRGKLTAAGSIFGSTPVELPLELPKLDGSEDAQAEIAKLIVFGKDLAERLVAQKAEDWLRNKLPMP